jgi:hypothetical protein
MNDYKHQWMIQAGILHVTPHVSYDPQTNNLDVGVSWELASEIADAVTKTRDAIAMGFAISQIDGPLPIADVVGFAFAVKSTVSAWWEVFD